MNTNNHKPTAATAEQKDAISYFKTVLYTGYVDVEAGQYSWKILGDSIVIWTNDIKPTNYQEFEKEILQNYRELAISFDDYPDGF